MSQLIWMNHTDGELLLSCFSSESTSHHRYFSVFSLMPIVAYRDIKIKAQFYSDFDFSWTAQKGPMCLSKTAALVGPIGLTTLQKEGVTVCATLQKEWLRSFTEY